ncbi:MAG: hypothetical protein ACRCTI_04140 [Beijerinckiaceae bacterium]
MKPQGWFQKDKSASKRPAILGGPALPRSLEASRIAAKLRPHELIAMLTHHYTRARARSLPRVKVSITVQAPNGRQAVLLACK